MFSSNIGWSSIFFNVFVFLCVLVRLELCNSTWVTTNYTVIPTNDAVDQSIVAVTFEQTRTAVECGAKCSQSASASFYFIYNGTSTCHCNNAKDNTIVPSGMSGVMKYGYVDDPATTTTPQSTTNTVFTTCNDISTGWTVFQRREDGSVDFLRNWVDYVNGFGDTTGEFWLGLEAIHQATASGCELCIKLFAGPNSITNQESGYALYSSFSVGDSSTKYRLTVDGFSGTVTDNLSYHNNCSFTTPDSDNDNSASNCADSGSWWFNACHLVSLNGLYLGGANTDYGNGINWRDPWGFEFSLLKTEMAYRC